MHKVFFTHEAQQDLQDIYDHIAQDNPFYASEVVIKIHTSIDFLKEFPYIGTLFRDNIRYIVEPKYHLKIVYRIISTHIEILSVFKYQERWN